MRNKKKSTVADCILKDLQCMKDSRGNLAVVESQIGIPFDIKRIYYIYDVPSGSSRAAHAHKNLHQLFIALSGSFKITLNDSFSEWSLVLSNPSKALYVPPMLWRDLTDFSSNAVTLVLASSLYDESDYIRDFDNFCKIKSL